MKRLGLCCLFVEAPIRFRQMTATHLMRQEGREKLSQLILENIAALIEAIRFCAAHQTGSFRISSRFLPCYTHPDCGYEIGDLPDAAEIYRQLERARMEGVEKGIRLTFHPDQFVVINSPSEEVVERSIAELEYHALLAELVGADLINIHAGGKYGDAPAALDRFARNVDRLSDRARSRLTVENDDRLFSPADLLPLCRSIGVPMVYDVHHHRCHPDGMGIEEATEAVLKLWDREPLFHVSSPKPGGDPRLHADFIDPDDLPLCWDRIDSLTVEVEAKMKELAVEQLHRDLQKRGW